MARVEKINVPKPQEEIYLLKNGMLYSLNRLTGHPLTMDEVMAAGSRFQLMIDDSYFFYVIVGKLNVARKKIRAVVSNYLQSMFPMDLFAGFALEENKGVYTALVYREDLGELIQNNETFFRMARRISSAFCELSARYDTFLFTDGNRVYEKKGLELEVLTTIPEGTLHAEDVWGEILPPRREVQFEGIKKSRDALKGYQTFAIVVAACYLLFLAAGIIGLQTQKKLDRSYEAQLQSLYASAGVAGSPDPYGLLRSRADRQMLAPFRVLDVLYNLGGAVPEPVQVDSFNVNERLVRVEGFTRDFAEMEQLRESLETKLRKQITVEDSRQAGDLIKFTIRYEP